MSRFLSFFFCMWMTSCFKTIYGKAFHFSIKLTLLHVNNQLIIFLRIYFWATYFVPLTEFFFFYTIITSSCYCSFTVNLEVKECQFLNTALLYQYCVRCTGCFAFPYKIQKTICQYPQNDICWNLDWDWIFRLSWKELTYS